MTTADYWQQLPPFDHIITYSFNRELQPLLDATEAELQTARYMRQPALRRQLERLQQHAGVPLLDEAGGLHSTAGPVARLSCLDAAVTELRRILIRPVEWDVWSGCAPIYRDAVVFCDAEGRRVGVLNVCLQCAYLLPEQGEFLQRDVRVFDELRDWLRNLGHPVDEP